MHIILRITFSAMQEGWAAPRRGGHGDGGNHGALQQAQPRILQAPAAHVSRRAGTAGQQGLG